MISWQAWTAPVAFLSSLILARCDSPEHIIVSGMPSTLSAVRALKDAGKGTDMNGHVELPMHACIACKL